jgi:fused signal recognition particle receptor
MEGKKKLAGQVVELVGLVDYQAGAVVNSAFEGTTIYMNDHTGSATGAYCDYNAVDAAQARKADYPFIDTAGRLHTKHNLTQELQKLHRVIGKQLPGAPHEVLLVLDATTGMNALNQAREFNKAVPLTPASL